MTGLSSIDRTILPLKSDQVETPELTASAQARVEKTDLRKFTPGARIVEASLGTFVDLGIGFLPHALQESLAEDLHRPEFGRVGSPGFMAFVLMDGSVRPGHGIFNKYADLALNPASIKK